MRFQPPDGQQFGRTIADMQRKIAELSTKNTLKSASIEDRNAPNNPDGVSYKGDGRITSGGFQTRIKFGEQSDGTWAVWTFDASGNPITKQGTLPEGVYGFAAYDTEGNLQSLVGELPDGTHGIAQLARQGVSDGQLVDIGLLCSPIFETHEDVVNTSSTDYQSSDKVTATATIGASGVALVTVSAFVYVDATAASGAVGLYIDGALVYDGIVLLENNSGGGIGNNGSGFWLETGLSAGSHTFSLRSKTSDSSVTVGVASWQILVQPY